MAPPAAADSKQFNSSEAWQLHSRVSLRPEPFGALAYHYDNRRLNFVRSHDLVAVLRSLGDHESVTKAFQACDVDSARWPSFEKALQALAFSKFVERQPAS